MNKQTIEKGTDRVLELATHVLDAMQLVPPSPDVHTRSEALFQRMEDVDQSIKRQEAAEQELATARDEADSLRKRLLRTSRGGAEFLVAAEPELEAKLPLGDIFANVDPKLLAERILSVGKHATTDEGKMIARMVALIHRNLGQAEARQVTAGKEKQKAVLDRANKNWALQTVARDAELFIRLVSPKGSPALRHVQARKNRPGPKPKPAGSTAGTTTSLTATATPATPSVVVPESSQPAVAHLVVVPAPHLVPAPVVFATPAPSAGTPLPVADAPAAVAPVVSNGATGLHSVPSTEVEKVLA